MLGGGVTNPLRPKPCKTCLMPIFAAGIAFSLESDRYAKRCGTRRGWFDTFTRPALPPLRIAAMRSPISRPAVGQCSQVTSTASLLKSLAARDTQSPTMRAAWVATKRAVSRRVADVGANGNCGVDRHVTHVAHLAC